MAFDRKYLYCVGPNAGPRRVWKYDTLDALADVDTAGYFNSAAKELSIGDEIHTVVWATAIGTGGTVSAAGICIVLSNASGVVDVGDHTAINVSTDTD